MKDKITKFISVTKKDGLFKSLKKAGTYIVANYYNKINLKKRISYKKNRKNILKDIQISLEGKYDRILVWRSSFGWNVPLFQRPQQIAKCLSEKKCLIFYEVTRMTDKTKFFEKLSDNIYLVNYEIKAFENDLFDILNKINKPKYLQLYSTCWNVSNEVVKKYVTNGYKLLYEYIDDLNPSLAGTSDLPKNVQAIHNYVIDNPEHALVVTSADKLYSDMKQKRKSNTNLILSSNGVDLKHFTSKGKKVLEMDNIKKQYKTIIGYYGALAIWFDYEILKELAKNNPDKAFVLIGIKYDTSYDDNHLEKYSNIINLGPKDYKDLVNYAKYFDIAWIPFVINEITLATNPIKVFEYMAMEKFIITSPMPECKKYKSVNIASDLKEYQYYIDNYLKLSTSKYKKILKEEAKNNSWDKKANDIIELLVSNEKNVKE